MPPTPFPNTTSRPGKRRNADSKEDAPIPKKTKIFHIKPTKLKNPASVRARQMTFGKAPQATALRDQTVTSKSFNSGHSAANLSNKVAAAGENPPLAKKAATSTQLQSGDDSSNKENIDPVTGRYARSLPPPQQPLKDSWDFPFDKAPMDSGTWIEYATSICKSRIKSGEIEINIAVSFIDSMLQSAKANSSMKHISPEETTAREVYRVLSPEERKLVYEDADFEQRAVILDTSEDLIKAEIIEHKRPCTRDIEVIPYDQLQPTERVTFSKVEALRQELDEITEDMHTLRKEYREWCDDNGKPSRKLLMRPILRIDESETRDVMREVRKDIKGARQVTTVSNVNDMFSTSRDVLFSNPTLNKGTKRPHEPETSDQQQVGAPKKRKRMRISDPIDIFEDQKESETTLHQSQSMKAKAPIQNLGLKRSSRDAELDDSDSSEDDILPRKTKQTKVDDRSNLEKAKRRGASTAAPPAPRQKIAPKSRSAPKKAEVPLVEPEPLQQLPPKTLKMVGPQTRILELAAPALVNKTVSRPTPGSVDGSGFLTSLIGSIGQAHPINNLRPSGIYSRAGLKDNGSDESGRPALTSSVQPNYRRL